MSWGPCENNTSFLRPRIQMVIQLRLVLCSRQQQRLNIALSTYRGTSASAAPLSLSGLRPQNRGGVGAFVGYLPGLPISLRATGVKRYKFGFDLNLLPLKGVGVSLASLKQPPLPAPSKFSVTSLGAWGSKLDHRERFRRAFTQRKVSFFNAVVARVSGAPASSLFFWLAHASPLALLYSAVGMQMPWFFLAPSNPGFCFYATLSRVAFPQEVPQLVAEKIRSLSSLVLFFGCPQPHFGGSLLGLTLEELTYQQRIRLLVGATYADFFFFNQFFCAEVSRLTVGAPGVPLFSLASFFIWDKMAVPKHKRYKLRSLSASVRPESNLVVRGRVGPTRVVWSAWGLVGRPHPLFIAKRLGASGAFLPLYQPLSSLCYRAGGQTPSIKLDAWWGSLSQKICAGWGSYLPPLQDQPLSLSPAYLCSGLWRACVAYFSWFTSVNACESNQPHLQGAYFWVGPLLAFRAIYGGYKEKTKKMSSVVALAQTAGLVLSPSLWQARRGVAPLDLGDLMATLKKIRSFFMLFFAQNSISCLGDLGYQLQHPRHAGGFILCKHTGPVLRFFGGQLLLPKLPTIIGARLWVVPGQKSQAGGAGTSFLSPWGASTSPLTPVVASSEISSADFLSFCSR